MPDPRFKLTIIVDEETLRDATDAETEDTIEGLIEKEFGWLNSSGVVLEKIEQISEESNTKPSEDGSYSHQEIVNNIKEVLPEVPGYELADIHNEICANQVVHAGNNTYKDAE